MSQSRSHHSIQPNDYSHAIFLLLGCWLAFGLSGCQNIDFAGANQGDSEKESAESLDASDRADIPVNVTGSYLACAIRKEASGDDPGRQIGCRLSDPETGAKLDLSTYTDDAVWSIAPSELATVSPQADHPVWHVFYDFPEASPEAADAALNQSTIRVQLSLKAPGQTLSFAADTPEVMQPIENFDDFDAPIMLERGIEPETPGPL
jgi:hypothetical protein